MTQTQTSTQTMAAGNMPGGGAAKEMMKKSMPVDKLYTTVKANEKGEVDVAKVAALKSNPKRIAPLKRTSKIRLSKSEWQTVKDQRKEAAKKYAERSQQVKKEKVYRKNAVARLTKREEKLVAAQKRPEKKMNNCSIMYSVGPHPKSMTKSEQFRAFRSFARTQVKFGTPVKKEEHVSFIYKVGSPVKAVVAK